MATTHLTQSKDEGSLRPLDTQAVGQSGDSVNDAVNDSVKGYLSDPSNQEDAFVDDDEGDKPNHYETLGISTDASQEELRDAYGQLKQTFSADGQAFYSLMSREEASEALGDIEHAFIVLKDPATRARYDQSIGISVPEILQDTTTVIEWTPEEDSKERDSASVQLESDDGASETSELEELDAASKSSSKPLSKSSMSAQDSMAKGMPPSDSSARVQNLSAGEGEAYPLGSRGRLGLGQNQASASTPHALPGQEEQHKSHASRHQSDPVPVSAYSEEGFDTHAVSARGGLSSIPKQAPGSTSDIVQEAMREILEKGDYGDGFLYKELRQAAGVSEDELQLRTKVSLEYIRCIESNQFNSLPPAVYVRGFLRSCFKYLSVPDPERLVAAFSKRYDEWCRKKKRSRL